MISDKTIAELQKAVTPTEHEVNGEKFFSKALHRPPLPDYEKEPQPTALVLHSLTSLVEYIKSVDAGKSVVIHVESPSQVSVVSHLYGPSKQRDVLAVARFEHAGFPFGQAQDNETFIVFLQSRFVRTTDVEKVLRVVGNIKDEVVKQFSDDGTTQAVTAKAGIVKVEEVPVPNPVNLAPFRTFPDVDQPVSPFILRMAQGNPLPRCTLHEADGGRWQNEARANIREFLQTALPEAVILA
jgi:hypothetical protein